MTRRELFQKVAGAVVIGCVPVPQARTVPDTLEITPGVLLDEFHEHARRIDFVTAQFRDFKVAVIQAENSLDQIFRQHLIPRLRQDLSSNG